ncbi:MAG: Spx/MgsR family RNA polymerase-binding regulatory protein [Chthoniobacterales bacterium]
MLKVYTYAKCSTCRNAVKFLQSQNIPFKDIPIRETPPSLKELQGMLSAYQGQIRKLFNTSGLDYRAAGLGVKLPKMKDKDALSLLTTNGNLVKRPFAIDEKTHLVGFDETVWRNALGK